MGATVKKTNTMKKNKAYLIISFISWTAIAVIGVWLAVSFAYVLYSQIIK